MGFRIQPAGQASAPLPITRVAVWTTVVTLSSAAAEHLTESAAAAFMKCSPTAPSALTWFGEHSEDGFQRVSEYSGGLWAILQNWPAEMKSDPPRVVVIDPDVSSGRPVVNGTGVTAEVIVGRFNTGEGVGRIAEDYGLNVSQVEGVIRYARAA